MTFNGVPHGPMGPPKVMKIGSSSDTMVEAWSG